VRGKKARRAVTALAPSVRAGLSVLISKRLEEPTPNASKWCVGSSSLLGYNMYSKPHPDGRG